MSFAERNGPAEAFEKTVIERLRLMGWHAAPFGQGLLSDDVRDALKRFDDASGRPCLLRWMPDIIAYRDYPGGRSLIRLLDAKCCGDRTPNYAIELSAIEAAEIYVDCLLAPLFFIFDDWRVLTPRDARQRGRPGSETNSGSGTAYLLVSKRYGAPPEKYFPPVRPRVVA